MGAALAYGLLRNGLKVAVFDEGDNALRASRGNFGLVWVQGKGKDNPDYARWSRASAQNWTQFDAELHDFTGIDPVYRQTGGVTLALEEAELNEYQHGLQSLRQQLGGDYEFELMDRDALLPWFPGLGDEVCGGTYCPFDGHVNPLRLLRALHSSIQKRGGHYRVEHRVDKITALVDGGFQVDTQAGCFEAQKIVLAAGLGNRHLGPQVGLQVPVSPLQGQLLITERTQPMLPMATHSIRQTDEGAIQIGFSEADVGLDTEASVDICRGMAQRALRLFPTLKQLRIVRSWSALRVMTPDAYPIYDESDHYPGAYVATCHSGVTLAANHATTLANWIASGPGTIPDEIKAFSARRFDVPAHA